MDYTIFGESHGPAIGVVLEDVPAGVELDLDLIAAEMARRAPGKSPLSTPRKETDQVSLDALGEGEVLDAIRRCQVETLTPLEAMNLIYGWKQKLT